MLFTNTVRGLGHKKGSVSFSGTRRRSNPLLIGVAGNAAEALGERLRVAVLAARAYLGAAAQRVPGGIRPFDFGVIAHGVFSW
jgi:hypothetical protein